MGVLSSERPCRVLLGFNSWENQGKPASQHMPERREESTGIKIGGSLKREVMTWEICKTLLESAYFLGMRVKAVQTNFL